MKSDNAGCRRSSQPLSTVGPTRVVDSRRTVSAGRIASLRPSLRDASDGAAGFPLFLFSEAFVKKSKRRDFSLLIGTASG